MNDTYGCTRGNLLSGRENLPRRGKSTWKDPVICRTLMESFLRLEQGGQQGERLKVRLEKQAGTTPRRALWTR